MQHIVVLSDLKINKIKIFKKNIYIYKDNKKGVYGAINWIKKSKGEFILYCTGITILQKKHQLIENFL